MNKNFLTKHFLTLNKSAIEIALELNISLSKVKNKLNKYNLKKTKELIYQSRELKCFKELGLNSEKIKEICIKINSKEWVYQEYIIQNKSTQEIADQLGIPKYIIANRLKALEIKKNKKVIIDRMVINYKKKNLVKYGVDNPIKLTEIKEKRDQTNLEKYGSKNVFASKQIQEKIKETNQKRYGYDNPSKSPNIIEKIHETKLKNGTYGKSELEDYLYYLIYDEVCKDVERQYNDDPRYPHACDFYLENTDCFIELQGDSFRHLREPHNGSNLPEKYVEKSCDLDKPKRANNYKNAIKVYTVSDPLKRMYASLYNLNYLEIWASDISKGWDWVHFLLQKQGLPLVYKEEVIQREFQNISKQIGNFSRITTQNKIIEYFQPHFYRKERELWNNPKIREKLVENREKYKFKSKEELTNKEILQGFKISGIHIGYSFFSPLWIKAFIKKYNIKSIYDPCMGWGHRLLGAKDILYIGNDSDIDTFQGNIKISEYFNITNKVFYNKPAEEFIPKESYEAVFTCPPYYDTEIYNGENTSTVKYSSYDSWLNVWWRKVIQNCLINSPKYFSFVINAKYKEDMQAICVQEGLIFLEEIPVGKNVKNHFQRVSKNSYKGESLLILKS